MYDCSLDRLLDRYTFTSPFTALQLKDRFVFLNGPYRNETLLVAKCHESQIIRIHVLIVFIPIRQLLRTPLQRSLSNILLNLTEYASSELCNQGKSSAPYYALIVLLLSTFTTRILLNPTVQKIGTRVSDRTRSDIMDTQLYPKLLSGTPLKKWEPHALLDVAKKQITAVVENACLR